MGEGDDDKWYEVTMTFTTREISTTERAAREQAKMWLIGEIQMHGYGKVIDKSKIRIKLLGRADPVTSDLIRTRE